MLNKKMKTSLLGALKRLMAVSLQHEAAVMLAWGYDIPFWSC